MAKVGSGNVQVAHDLGDLGGGIGGPFAGVLLDIFFRCSGISAKGSVCYNIGVDANTFVPSSMLSLQDPRRYSKLLSAFSSRGNEY